MRLRQMRNDADNAHNRANVNIRKYMRKYSRIYANMRINSHQCASEKSGT